MLRITRNLLLIFLFFSIVGSPSALCAEENFRLLTLPKSGTHLLVKCLYLLGAIDEVSESQFQGLTLDREQQDKYGWHIHSQNPEWFAKKKCKYLITVRDVRDVILSVHNWMPYLYEKTDRPDLLNQVLHEYSGNPSQQISGLIRREPDLLGTQLLERYQSVIRLYHQRKSLHNVLFIKFEDLVGPEGGGDINQQQECIRNIARFLNIPDISDERVKKIATSLWGETETFCVSPHKRKIGRWKEVYSPDQVKDIHRFWDDYLLAFGYEKDRQWSSEEGMKSSF